jgi:hypothetical protein
LIFVTTSHEQPITYFDIFVVVNVMQAIYLARKQAMGVFLSVGLDVSNLGCLLGVF